MRSRDWSLVFLTVLSQGRIGIVLGLTVLAFSFGVTPGSVVPLFLALLMVWIATTASFFHLGNPSNAPLALSNLSGSWLSREILAIGVFVFLLGVTLLFVWAGGDNGIARVLLLLASAAGLFLLWAMTRVYLIPTIPPWNHWYTPVSFTATTLSLGLLGTLLFTDIGVSGKSLLMGVLALVLVLELLAGFLNQRRLAGLDSGFDGPVLERGAYFRLYIARMAILFLVCVAAANGDLTWMYPLSVLVVLQEFAGRLLFYASYFRVGL